MPVIRPSAGVFFMQVVERAAAALRRDREARRIRRSCRRRTGRRGSRARCAAPCAWRVRTMSGRAPSVSSARRACKSSSSGRGAVARAGTAARGAPSSIGARSSSRSPSSTASPRCTWIACTTPSAQRLDGELHLHRLQAQQHRAARHRAAHIGLDSGDGALHAGAVVDDRRRHREQKKARTRIVRGLPLRPRSCGQAGAGALLDCRRRALQVLRMPPRAPNTQSLRPWPCRWSRSTAAAWCAARTAHSAAPAGSSPSA